MNNEEMKEVTEKNKDVVEMLNNIALVEQVERQNRLNVVTQYATTVVAWLCIAAVGVFAIWGITVGLDLLLKAWGVK